MKKIINSVRRFFNKIFKNVPPVLPNPPLPPIEVGVVAHRLNDADVLALRYMGVRHLRLSLYGNLDGEVWIDRAIAEGFSALVVSYRDVSDRAADRVRWPSVMWQYGNEPDMTKITPLQMAQYSTGGEVSPGLRTDTPPDWMSAYKSYADPNQIFAIHIYGDELTLATERRLDAIKTISGKRWVTEIGRINGPTDDFVRAINLMRQSGIERVYVYALWSPDTGYTLTDAQKLAIQAMVYENNNLLRE